MYFLRFICEEIKWKKEKKKQKLRTVTICEGATYNVIPECPAKVLPHCVHRRFAQFQRLKQLHTFALIENEFKKKKKDDEIKFLKNINPKKPLRTHILRSTPTLSKSMWPGIFSWEDDKGLGNKSFTTSQPLILPRRKKKRHPSIELQEFYVKILFSFFGLWIWKTLKHHPDSSIWLSSWVSKGHIHQRLFPRRCMQKKKKGQSKKKKEVQRIYRWVWWLKGISEK